MGLSLHAMLSVLHSLGEQKDQEGAQDIVWVCLFFLDRALDKEQGQGLMQLLPPGQLHYKLFLLEQAG